MAGWETRRGWLRRMADKIPEGLDTPLAVAKYEAAAFFADGRKVDLHLDRDLQEGYEISETDLTFPFVTIAIGQTPEEGCPLCGGAGHENTIGRIIQDTRTIINPYDKPEE